MIELCRFPAHWGVTSLAVFSPTLSDVVRRGGFCEIRAMARETGDVGSFKVTDLRTLVTRKTRGAGVRADQREPSSIMFGNLLHRPPRLLVVAVGTQLAELRAMDINVTPGTPLGDKILRRAAVVVAH